MQKIYLPLVIAMLLLAFWFSPDAQEVAAGVAIFLFGLLMLEDGFKRAGGNLLERLLARATSSTPRAMLFGFVSTTLLQSSSLVSVIAISFLSAGLITLLGGVGIILGANLGTTTGAWLVATLGLKVNIAAYAMPMMAIGAVLVFQKSQTLQGIGYALAGMGFVFLGIHHMKTGFETFNDHIDLLRFALPGILGLIVYTLVGTVSTVLMQSSHATMVLILTALSAGQITYENALALAIGANIGTTITALVGSIGANFQGKRLALAHLIFNATTAAVALALIAPLRDLVDQLSALLNIAPDAHAMKLAMFHTVFNLLGLLVMIPLLDRLLPFLERRISEPVPDISRPAFLNQAVDAFPQTLEHAVRNEVLHLYDNAVDLILHGLNLHKHELFDAPDIETLVCHSRQQMDFDFDEAYRRKIKPLYSAIFDFTTRVSDDPAQTGISQNVHNMRNVARQIVQAIKAIKHLRKNVLRYATRDQGTVTDLYDALRSEIARIIVEIHRLEQQEPEERSALWLDQERAQVQRDARATTHRVEALIRAGQLDASAATSFLTDSGYAYSAMRQLLKAARSYYIERDSGIGEVERLVSMDAEELDAALSRGGPAPRSNAPDALRPERQDL